LRGVRVPRASGDGVIPVHGTVVEVSVCFQKSALLHRLIAQSSCHEHVTVAWRQLRLAQEIVVKAPACRIVSVREYVRVAQRCVPKGLDVSVCLRHADTARYQTLLIASCGAEIEICCTCAYCCVQRLTCSVGSDLNGCTRVPTTSAYAVAPYGARPVFTFARNCWYRNIKLVNSERRKWRLLEGEVLDVGEVVGTLRIECTSYRT